MAEYTIFGFTWQGAWSSSTAYNPYDVVTENGSLYNCILANTNHDPATDGGTHWQVAASKGDTGATGSTGPAGASDTTVIGSVYTADGAISESKGTVFLNKGTYSLWQSNHVYAVGAVILDGFGRLQQVTTAGTSNAFAQPFSTTTLGQTTTDGVMVWTDIGAGFLSMTLAAPTSGTNDGYLLRILSLEINPHQIAVSGGANFSTIKFAQGGGAPSYDNLTLMAYQGKWYRVKSETSFITFS
jgi:hypothetical protein